MIGSFLQTKLYHPPLPPQQVSRPQLLARLNQGLAAGHNLTLIAAPAGFGKTTLVCQWLADLRTYRPATLATTNRHAITISFAWLSLDEDDNDLGLFLYYIVAAVQHIFPTACANILRLLQAPQLPPLPDLVMTLINDLAALASTIILVLEDYHLIVDPAIHQLLTRLLEHLPPSLHLILTSRTEPPLPLARWRVRQQMTEIRAADLCFSNTETGAFLTQALGKTPPPEMVTTLQAQTEGWVAGLQLAALALQSPRWPYEPFDEAAFVQAFKGSKRHVMDYLMDEVLTRQPQVVQVFLIQTSILDRFCAPLCAALGRGVGPEMEDATPHPQALAGSQSILAYLERANLFVTPLDEQGEWYRYHPLFRELLRHHLHARTSAAEIALLHGQASTWLADHGFIEEALPYALASGDRLAAARLVEQHRHTLLNREDWHTLERWLALVPADMVRQRPALILAQAFVLNFQFKWLAIPALLQVAAACLDDEALTKADTQALWGEIAALWSQHWYWQNDGQRSLTYAQQALDQLPAEYLYVRSGALFYWGLAAQMMGQYPLAMQTLRLALEPHLAYPSTFSTRLLFALTLMDYLAGALTRLQQTAQEFCQVATQAKLGISIAWAHYLLGVVYYELNELATAAHHFTAVVELRYSVHALAAHNGRMGLALTYQAQGQFEQAQQQIVALQQFHQETHNLAFLPATDSLQARLALQQGNRQFAVRWAQIASPAPIREPLLVFEIPQITYVKVLLSQATVENLQEATRILAELQQVAEATQNTLRLVELLALQALVAHSQTQPDLALRLLEQAVVLAKPGRFIRTFVDLGAALARLLYQLLARGVEVDYLRQVLAAFPTGAAESTQRNQATAQIELIEPLTEREQEVLALLARRFSNQEIAQVLTISPLTIRTHTSNIYQKFGVNSRQQAVTRARTLGILPT